MSDEAKLFIGGIDVPCVSHTFNNSGVAAELETSSGLLNSGFTVPITTEFVSDELLEIAEALRAGTYCSDCGTWHKDGLAWGCKNNEQ